MAYITHAVSESREESNVPLKSCRLGVPKVWRNQMAYKSPSNSRS